MLRNIHKKYGEAFTIKFLDKLFKLGVYTLQKFGFSTGIGDTDLPQEAIKKIQETLNKAEDEVDELIKRFHKGELDTFPGKDLSETVELKILEALNKARNETGKIVTAYAKLNTGASTMTLSGARGNPINMAQIIACVGQQALRGKRIDKGYEERTLSCFKPKDLSPAARGFIRNGFKSGLTPAEFFFASMTGRDSLMDTALRTPKSGYLYRRLANAMQDLKVEYDATVRDATKRVIQFSYGEDGIDVAKSEGGTLDTKKIIEQVMGDEE